MQMARFQHSHMASSQAGRVRLRYCVPCPWVPHCCCECLAALAARAPSLLLGRVAVHQLQDALSHGLLVELRREHLAGMDKTLAIHKGQFKLYVHLAVGQSLQARALSGQVGKQQREKE